MLHVCACGAAGGAQPFSWSRVRRGWPLAHRRVYFVCVCVCTNCQLPRHGRFFFMQ